MTKDINYSFDTVKLQTLLDQLDVAIENKDDDLIKTIIDGFSLFNEDIKYLELIKYLIDWYKRKGLKCSIAVFDLLCQKLNFDINDGICLLDFATREGYNINTIKAIVNNNMYHRISASILKKVIDRIGYCNIQPSEEYLEYYEKHKYDYDIKWFKYEYENRQEECLEILYFLLKKDSSDINCHPSKKGDETVLDFVKTHMLYSHHNDFNMEILKLLSKYGAK